MIPNLLRVFLGESWRTTCFGLSGLVCVIGAVIAPKWGLQVDFLYVAVAVLCLGQIFGADASAILNVRKYLDEAKK